MATTEQTQPQQGTTPAPSQMTGSDTPKQPGQKKPIYRDWAAI